MRPANTERRGRTFPKRSHLRPANTDQPRHPHSVNGVVTGQSGVAGDAKCLKTDWVAGKA